LKVKVERIDILPHARSPVGNYAIIKLIGINRLEGPPVFSIDPIEDTGAGDDWPKGELKPLGVRAGTQSIELLVGPEIVRSGRLKPGVPFRLRMPSANVDMQLEWPLLELGNVMKEGPSATPLTGGAQLSLTPSANTSNGKSTAVTTERGLARLNVKRTGSGGAQSVRPEPVRAGPNGPLAGASNARPLDQAAERAAGLPPGQPPQVISTPVADQNSALLPLALGFIIVVAMMVVFVRTTTIEGSGVTFFSALRQAIASEETARDPLAEPTRVLARIMSTAKASPADVPATEVSKRQALERANDLLQSAKTPEERAEAAFWLRKALSDSFSRPRLTWAVTQLGAAYASSDSKDQPNYEAARLLWNWAADAGDAQASCFLGKLYEQGLGVTVNTARARHFYHRAQELGGCPRLKQAISRIGK